MAEFIRNWIINIITIVLFIIMLEIIMPSGKTKKYVNLVTGFILIIAIINPFIKLLKGEQSLETFQLKSSAEIQKLEIEKSSSLYKKEQMRQITEVYRQKVIKQLVKSAEETEGVAEAEADVIINEDYNSESFGEIKRAYINITPETEDDKTKPVNNVKKVRVKLDSISDGKENAVHDGESIRTDADNAQINTKVRKSIEEKVGKLFNLESKDIVIGLQEK